MSSHNWEIQKCPWLRAWLDAKTQYLYDSVCLSTSQLCLTLPAAFLRQAPLCQFSNLTKNNQLFLFSGIKISKDNSHWVMCPSLTNLYGLGWGTLIGLAWLKPSALVSREDGHDKKARWVREKFLKDKEKQHFLNSVFNERLGVCFSYFQPRILTTKASCRKWDGEEGDFSRHRTVTLHTTSPQGCWCRAVALSSWPSSYTTRETHQIEEWEWCFACQRRRKWAWIGPWRHLGCII